MKMFVILYMEAGGAAEMAEETFTLQNWRTLAHPKCSTPAHPNCRTPAHPNYRTPAHPNCRTPAHPNCRTPAHPNCSTPAVTERWMNLETIEDKINLCSWYVIQQGNRCLLFNSWYFIVWKFVSWDVTPWLLVNNNITDVLREPADIWMKVREDDNVLFKLCDRRWRAYVHLKRP